MATTTTTLTPANVVASATNTAGSTTRGTRDMRGKHGGLLTLKITNGATGPTVQCEGRVLVAHNSGSTPTAASAGSDWKTIFSFGGGTTNNGITEQHIVLPPCCHVEVEFTGNTAQSVTVESVITDYTDLQTA